MIRFMRTPKRDLLARLPAVRPVPSERAGAAEGRIPDGAWQSSGPLSAAHDPCGAPPVPVRRQP